MTLILRSELMAVDRV